MAACPSWDVWFHYEDGSKDGVWLRFLSYTPGPCESSQTIESGPAFEVLPFQCGGFLNCGFTNPKASPIYAQFFGSAASPGEPFQFRSLAQALYDAGATTIEEFGYDYGIADDFSEVYCGDGTACYNAFDNPCDPGYYYDVEAELCKPICGTNPLFCAVVLVPLPEPMPPFICKPPGIVKLVNGVPVCMMDPPIPSNLPNHLPLADRFAGKPATRRVSVVKLYSDDYRRSLVARWVGDNRIGLLSQFEVAYAQRESNQIASAKHEFSLSELALNPTVKPGVPRTFKYCGCNDDRDDGELEIIG